MGTTSNIRFRFDDETLTRLDYWAEKHGMSRNEYVNEAIDRQFMRENLDFDVPSALVQRVNQLVAAQESTRVSMDNLVKQVHTGFESLLSLVRGDNYLNQQEDLL